MDNNVFYMVCSPITSKEFEEIEGTLDKPIYIEGMFFSLDDAKNAVKEYIEEDSINSDMYIAQYDLGKDTRFPVKLFFLVKQWEEYTE